MSAIRTNERNSDRNCKNDKKRRSNKDKKAELSSEEEESLSVNVTRQAESKKKSKYIEILNNMILKNKINSSNAFEIPLFKVSNLKEFEDSEDKGAWTNLSSALEIGAKIYGWRVDSVFTHTYKLLGGLNRGNKDENLDQDASSQIESEKNDKEVLTPKKNQRNSKCDRYIETNTSNISSNNFDLEFDLDPMFEKNSRQFDGADSKSLLLSKLTVDENMLLNLGMVKNPPLIGKRTFKKNFLPLSEYTNINIDYYKLKNFRISPIAFDQLESESDGSVNDLDSSFNFSQNKRNKMDDEFFLSDLKISNESKIKLKPFPLNENSLNILNEQESQDPNQDFNMERQMKLGNESNFNCKGSADNLDYFKKWNIAILENENDFFGKGKTFMNENFKETDLFTLCPQMMRPVKERKEPQFDRNANKTQNKHVLDIEFKNIENVAPLFLKQKTIDLHSFFESKVALQKKEIEHYFLLPLDLHLKFSRINEAFLNSNIKINRMGLEQEKCKNNSFDTQNEVKFDQERNIEIKMTYNIPIQEVKKKLWNNLEPLVTKGKTTFNDVIDDFSKEMRQKSHFCSVHTVFLSLLHIANEKNLKLLQQDESSIEVLYS